MPETLVWLVPLAVLAAGARDPRGGLLVLAASLPLFGSPPGGPYLAALEVAALLAVAMAWRAGKGRRSALDAPVLAFVAVSAVSLLPMAYSPPSWRPAVLLRLLAALPGVEPWTPLYGWRAMLDLCLGVGLFLAVRRAFAGRSPRPLFLALGAGLAATLALGLAARAELIDLGHYRIEGGPNWEGRLHALFFHSGWLAEFLVLATPVAVAALAAGGRRSRRAAALLLALTLPALALTAQRGAWLTALVQLGLAGLLWGRSILDSRAGRRALALAIGGAAALVALVMLSASDTFGSASARLSALLDFQDRSFIWSVAAEMAGERPLLGWGLGAFSPVYHQIMSPPRVGVFDWLTAHNQYLMLMVERGAFGLTAFVLVVWALGRSLWAARRVDSAETRMLAGGLLVSLAGLLVYSLVQYVFFLRALQWLFWGLAGTAAVLAPSAGSRAGGRWALALTALALLAVPWRLLAVEPLEVPGNRAFGLHRSESSGGRTFQWTTGYAAFRQPAGERLRLELANGHPRPDRHRVEAAIRVDGRELLRAEIPGRWTPYELELPPPARGWLLVEIEARPTFRPFNDYRRHPELDRSVDLRSLGVAVALRAAPSPGAAVADCSP